MDEKYLDCWIVACIGCVAEIDLYLTALRKARKLIDIEKSPQKAMHVLNKTKFVFISANFPFLPTHDPKNILAGLFKSISNTQAVFSQFFNRSPVKVVANEVTLC
jgi:hypothetical protein